jgi:predicted naringenin-chalcone synthase
MTCFLRGIGLYQPEHQMEQMKAAEIATELSGADARGSRRMTAVFRRAGVERRSGVSMVECEGGLEHRWLADRTDGVDPCPGTGDRIAQFMELAPGMACTASRNALEQAKIDASRVTHIVTASCTGFASPGVDHAIIDRLGLPRSTQRTNVGFMGCHAAINALRVAMAFAKSDPEAVVLVCCVEVCSLHFQGGESRDAMLANALFADGAAAAVVTGHPPEDADGIVLDTTASQFLPDSTDLMTWTVTDDGFRMTLDPAVPDRLESSVGGWVEEWLEGQGLAIPGIGAWAIHPGGPQILDAVRDALGVDESMCASSRGILARHGNMSSPTILFVLDELIRSGAPRPWGVLAFGPGLGAEGLLIR